MTIGRYDQLPQLVRGVIRGIYNLVRAFAKNGQLTFLFIDGLFDVSRYLARDHRMRPPCLLEPPDHHFLFSLKKEYLYGIPLLEGANDTVCVTEEGLLPDVHADANILGR